MFLCCSFMPYVFYLATRMALVWQVGEYIDRKEDIVSYIERVELHFEANYVEADYEVATFLALIGADAYGVLRNLLAPELPKDKFFDDLKELSFHITRLNLF